MPFLYDQNSPQICWRIELAVGNAVIRCFISNKKCTRILTKEIHRTHMSTCVRWVSASERSARQTGRQRDMQTLEIISQFTVIMIFRYNSFFPLTLSLSLSRFNLLRVRESLNHWAENKIVSSSTHFFKASLAAIFHLLFWVFDLLCFCTLWWSEIDWIIRMNTLDTHTHFH